MKRLLILSLFALPVLAEPKAKAAAKPKAEAVMVTPDDIKWGPAPAVIPAGAQLAVLHGDPGKAAPFTMRIKIPDGYKIAPHWHSQAENLTVISGTFVLSMGDKMDDASAHSLPAGSFHFLPAKMHHAATCKGETVVQVAGMGPFDIHYLNPADDPSKAAEAAAK